MLSQQLREFKLQMQTKTGVHILEDGSGSMVARAWLTENAEKSIDIQYFIFSTDNTGLIACDFLIKAADRGVKIRVLVDDIMIDAEAEDILTFNSHKNISVKIYNPGINLGKNIFQKAKKMTTDFRSVNQRMHNKTFTVDDKVVITGGRNIADEYFDYNKDYNFRDRDVLLVGKESKKVKTSFNEFWNSSLSKNVTDVVNSSKENYPTNNFHKLHKYAADPKHFWPQIKKRIKNVPNTLKSLKESDTLIWVEDINFISDIPNKNDEKKELKGSGTTTETLIELIKSATTTIDIQTPYLITTEVGINLFKETIKKGVKIRILTNSLASTDNVKAFSSYQKNRTELLKIGVEIFEFRPDAEERTKIMTGAVQKKLDHTPTFGLHAKTMIIDNKTAVIGTFNLDPRSANLNTECVVIIQSEKVSKKIEKRIEIEFKPENSWKTTLDFNPDSEATNYKRLKTLATKIIPKEIL